MSTWPEVLGAHADLVPTPGEELRVQRRRRGLSAQAAAAQCGYRLAYWSQVERGRLERTERLERRVRRLWGLAELSPGPLTVPERVDLLEQRLGGRAAIARRCRVSPGSVARWSAGVSVPGEARVALLRGEL